jgi:aspartate/methionine/tyrosine aminotransferase
MGSNREPSKLNAYTSNELRYEIRDIVAFAKKIEAAGQDITWENIGDPVAKGDYCPAWIMDIVSQKACLASTYSYSDSQGAPATRQFLSEIIGKRGGVSLSPSDILFTNGLGEAISRIFTMLHPSCRVLVPNPVYTALVQAEQLHSRLTAVSYRLHPETGWKPDFEEIDSILESDRSIRGILVVNPDNPTGSVLSKNQLSSFVELARKHGAFLIIDETYIHIQTETPVHASEVLEDIPALVLRSISKEFPWPGARCGWIEMYNRRHDEDFSTWCETLVAAKRLEVCSASLPQLILPEVIEHPLYLPHLHNRARIFRQRAREAAQILGQSTRVAYSVPQGAFYSAIHFTEPLPLKGQLTTASAELHHLAQEKTADKLPDARFCAWLLTSTGICCVPLSAFCSPVPGFRLTLLESDDRKRKWIYETVVKAVEEYYA